MHRTRILHDPHSSPSVSHQFGSPSFQCHLRKCPGLLVVGQKRKEIERRVPLPVEVNRIATSRRSDRKRGAVPRPSSVRYPILPHTPIRIMYLRRTSQDAHSTIGPQDVPLPPSIAPSISPSPSLHSAHPSHTIASSSSLPLPNGSPSHHGSTNSLQTSQNQERGYRVRNQPDLTGWARMYDLVGQFDKDRVANTKEDVDTLLVFVSLTPYHLLLSS